MAKAKAPAATVTINKKTYDKQLIEAAKDAVKGRGDGRVSKDDAVKILDMIKDDGTYSDLEKATLAFIRRTYKWTEAADDWFRDELRKWMASRKG